jgi:hypothetical protein
METKTYWLTTYALSSGIEKIQGNVSEWDSRCVYAQDWSSSCRLGVNVHETEEAARKAAESARLKKIASLRKQIEKLEKLSFK